MFFMIDGSFHGRVLHSVDVDVSYLVSSGTSVNVYFFVVVFGIPAAFETFETSNIQKYNYASNICFVPKVQ